MYCGHMARHWSDGPKGTVQAKSTACGVLPSNHSHLQPPPWHTATLGVDEETWGETENEEATNQRPRRVTGVDALFSGAAAQRWRGAARGGVFLLVAGDMPGTAEPARDTQSSDVRTATEPSTRAKPFPPAIVSCSVLFLTHKSCL